MGSKNMVEINGKLYDAHSGKLLDDTKTGITQKLAALRPQSTKKSANKSNGRFLDGVQHSGNSRSLAAKKPTSKSVKATSPKTTPTANKRSHKTAPNLKKKAQKSHTLHRRGTKAPVFDGFKPGVVQLNKGMNERLERAMKVTKSGALSKFSKGSSVEKSTPKATLVKEPVKILPKPIISKSPAAEVSKKQVTDKTGKTPKPRKYKKHISIFATVISVITIATLSAYIMYLNIPSISSKMASYQAGFSVSLPSYKPTGYAIAGPVKDNAGIVSINYKAKADERNFTLNQQPTKWDTQALKENYVAQKTKDAPLVYQNQGLTVYVYAGEASWVNGEKLFVLETKGSQLGVDQILKLASST